MARPTGRPIRDELVAAGQDLAQSHGVAAFSYADLAKRVGIQSPSIHHHFPRKEDLVAEIAKRYRQDFSEQLTSLHNRGSGRERLDGYRDLFNQVAVDGRLCLCGSAAAEWSSVGDAARVEVLAFFAEQQVWLSGVIADAMVSGEFSSSLDPQRDAELMLSALEGALLLARADIGGEPVNDVFERVMRFFTSD